MNVKKPVVLVVDDETAIINLERVVLEREGMEVISAGGGQEALDILSQQQPDIVVLDVMMPDMDGFTVLTHIREISTVPVLVVSGKRTAEMDKVQGLVIGADDYLVKPFSPLVLAARVKALLRRSGFSLQSPGS